MRVVEVRHRNVPLSRFAPVPAAPPGPAGGALATTVVALVSDVVWAGRPVVGYGFASVGRAPVGGLLDERFADRLLAAFDQPDADTGGNDGATDGLDPFALWPHLTAGEKPGGHGERCVAVGCLDMALWDLAGKLAGEPVHHLLARRLGRPPRDGVRVYAAGGYRYPDVDPATDRRLLAEEVHRFLDLGHTHVKIKIADAPLATDLDRVDAALAVLGDGSRLAVDALNRYSGESLTTAADALAGRGLWWFEDPCDPLDLVALADLARSYPGPLAAGEALFSLPDARNLLRYGGLRPGHDRLVFDPVHCYGVPEYVRIVEEFERAGWTRDAFWPHGGHLFAVHVAAALGLGGAELAPLAFQPFGGPPDGVTVSDGLLALPQEPGIGFERRRALRDLFATLA